MCLSAFMSTWPMSVQYIFTLSRTAKRQIYTKPTASTGRVRRGERMRKRGKTNWNRRTDFDVLSDGNPNSLQPKSFRRMVLNFPQFVRKNPFGETAEQTIFKKKNEIRRSKWDIVNHNPFRIRSIVREPFPRKSNGAEFANNVDEDEDNDDGTSK